MSKDLSGGQIAMPKLTEEDLKKMLEENRDLAKANPDLQIGKIVQLSGGELIEERIRKTAEIFEGEGIRLDSRPVSAKPSKYRNRRTEYNGMLYASKKEAQTAFNLDLLKAAGEISFWLRQVNFPLLGKMGYRADFVTFAVIGYTQGGITWIVKVIEVKGYQTEAWKMKRKLFV